MKSHKVSRVTPTREEAPERRAKPRHSTSLSDLKDRHKLKHQLKRSHQPPKVKKKGKGFMETLRDFNRALAKQSQKMPNDKEFSNWLWK